MCEPEEFGEACPSLEGAPDIVVMRGGREGIFSLFGVTAAVPYDMYGGMSPSWERRVMFWVGLTLRRIRM